MARIAGARGNLNASRVENAMCSAVLVDIA